MQLRDKVAVVTGAARGIGLACAERFAAEGARLVIADIDKAAGREAEARLNREGGTAVFLKTDVSSKIEVDRLIETAVERYGRIDVLLSNAGIARGGDFLEMSEETFDAVMRTNVKSVFLCGQAAARKMKDQGGGVIVNMSSINAVIAMPDQAAYVASKGAVNQLTKAMALALAPYNIRVNAVGPGTILTEFSRQAVMGDDEARRRVLARTPLGRCGEPAEVAASALFLATEASSYMTGQTIYLDGGRLALGYTVPVREEAASA